MDLYPKHRKHLYPERWMCTASMAAALALPRSLDGACQALGLKHQKDKDGHRLMLKMSKPGKKGWHNSLSDLKRLVQYCEQDIRAEIDLFLAIPPLSKDERKIWVLDQKINQRGFRIDRPLVDSALKLIAEEVENLRQETNDLSNGAFESTNRRAQVLQWLEARGTYLPDLTAKTVRDAISTGAVEGKSKRMLEIRQSVSKTSTAKFEAFRARADEHGYVRDNLLYHGASTGRWSGSGVQVQNFPKGSLKHEDIEIAVDAIKSGDLDWVRTLYGDPMRTFSNCLRGVIIPTEGREFFCADYASIELRMLFWFAGHEMGMKVLREGRDLYSELAAILYRKPVEEIEKGSKERFVAKSAILGCGYQLGGEKFQASCLLQGVEIDREMADLAVKTYRTTHYPVPQFWYNTERAAAAAVQSPGKKFRINKTTWFVKDEFLWAELPSGRRLAYYQPCIKTKKTSWGEDKAMLHHMGINPKTRKWELSGTYGGRLVENLVQAASRDLMAEAMLRLEDAGYQVVLSVHDEALAEILPGK
ncbi:MAG TPA: DNA polymerase, partial [Rhabdochlamydiaceae bacterium]